MFPQPPAERAFYETWDLSSPWRPSFDVEKDLVPGPVDETKIEFLERTFEFIRAFLKTHYGLSNLTAEDFRLEDATTATKYRCAGCARPASAW